MPSYTRRLTACCSPLPCRALVSQGSALEEVVVSNTIPLSPQITTATRKVRQLSVGKLLAHAINSIHTGDSVSRLFDPSKGAALLA